jgi:hypothetical protein
VDRSLATKLAQALAQKGVGCMLDPELIEGDPFWRETIAQRFPDCDLMIGLHSPFALASPWVQQEQDAFPGRKMWLAVDSPPVATVAELIPRDQALSAILAALPHRRQQPCATSRPAPRSSLKNERMALARDENSTLESFQRSCSSSLRRNLEITGEVARTGDGFMVLRRLPAFSKRDVYLGVLPVTNAQYREFLRASGYPEPPTWKRAGFRADDAPVTGVNWFEACAFAHWVGGSLPTEAEWVAAATGCDPSRSHATATGEIGDALACFGKPFGAACPAAATAHPPNPEGYYGMCGNTWDWCADVWDSHRVIRGGSCMDSADFCTTRTRYRNAPVDRDCSVGFRVKIELDVSRHRQGGLR